MPPRKASRGRKRTKSAKNKSEKKNQPAKELSDSQAATDPVPSASVNADQPGCSGSNQTPVDNDFIFLSDSDTDDEITDISPLNGQSNQKSKSDTDSIRSISPHLVTDGFAKTAQKNVAAYATVASSSPQPKKKGKGGSKSKGRKAPRRPPSLAMSTLGAFSNLFPFGGNYNGQFNIGRGTKKPAKRSKRSKRSQAMSSSQLVTSDDDLSYDSDDSCMLGMSPKGKRSAPTKKDDVVRGKKAGAHCDDEDNEKGNDSGSDKWSDSSSDSALANKKKVVNKKKGVAKTNATEKPKVSTDWSEEDLANMEILPEAAIFSNRIKDYSEQLKEFRKKEWMTKASLETEILKNKKTSKRKKKKNLLTFDDDDSDKEIAAKIPDVVPQRGSDDEEVDVEWKNVKVDEPITDEHISKTVQMRIMRKLRKMQEETKRIFPVGHTVSSDEDDEIENLSDSEDNPEIIVKVRWDCELLKISMKSKESFIKVFNEIAEKKGVKVSEIMLLLRDRTVTLEDTPKSLGITAGDFLDSCAYNVENKTKDTTANANFVQIMIQSSDSKAKQSFSIHKLEPLLVVMQKYSSKRNIPLEKMLFKFDGEKINPNNNAIDLDIDDDCCIDVKIL